MHKIFTSLQHLFIKSAFGVFIGVTLGFVTMTNVHAVGIAPSIVDVRAEPGQVVEQMVTVVNTESKDRTFTFDVVNFTPSETPGYPIFDGGADDDLPLWIKVSPSKITLAPGEAQPVNLTIALPKDAHTGDYYGAVLTGAFGDEISAQAALLVFLTVEGFSIYDTDLVEFNVSSKLSYPSGVMHVRIQNSGNVYIKPTGTVTINPLIGRKHAIPINPDELRILSKQSREWDIKWGVSDNDGVSGLKKEMSALMVGPVLVTAELNEGNNTLDSGEAVIWIIPWRFFMVVLLALVLAFVGKNYIARKLKPKHK